MSDFVKRFVKSIGNNSPALLTAFAVSGVIATGVLSTSATFKAAKILALRDENEPTLDKVKAVWPHYVPAAICAVGTIGCLIGSHTISTRRNAAILSAYTVSENAFRKYKDKVVEQLGEKKDQAVRDAVAQDAVNENPVSNNTVIVTGDGNVLCYESMTGRYFESDMQSIRKAQNDVNAQILNEMYASLNDFNRLLGLPATQVGDEMGWNSDHMLDLQISSILSENDRPCICIGYTYTPVRNYYKMY